MRQYGRVYTQFWTDDRVYNLSDQAKLVALYLLTGPHSNSIGCYRLPLGYVQADLGLTENNAFETLSELSRNGFIDRCESTSWVWIRRFLDWNPPENPNVAKGMMALIASVPESCGFFCVFASKINSIDWPGETLSKGFPNGFGTVCQTVSKQEPEPEPEPEPKRDSSAAPDDLLEAVDAFNGTAERVGWPQVQKLTDSRKAKLRRRLADCGGLSGWLMALERAAAIPWLCGENDRGWRADFDFLTTESKFTKLMEGGYDRAAKPANSNDGSIAAGFDRLFGDGSGGAMGCSAPGHA